MKEHCKPMMRWWLPAALVDVNEIDRELNEAKEAGFGGLEICINMADCKPTNKELRECGWATERWNKLYKHILKTANAMELQIDTTLSPAWPPAITGITPEDPAASKELSICATEVFTREFHGELPTVTCSITDRFHGNEDSGMPPMMVEEQPVTLPNRPVLVSVVAAKVIGEKDVTKTQCINWGDMPINWRERTRRTVLLDGGSFQRIDAKEGHIQFCAPDDGMWMIFVAWMQGTKQQNKQGRATEEPCLVIDHFGEAGSEALINFWETNLLDAETKTLLRENGGSLFEDSMEVNVSEGCIHWSCDLPKRFLQERGYDILDYFPLLHGMSCGGMSNTDFYTFECADEQGNIHPMGEQIRRDYKQIITTGFAYEHIERIQNWAKSLGLGFRCQCYSGLHDTALCSAVCAGPEGESLGFGPDVQGDDRFRMVSGGAHMNLRNRITDEVGALANKGYRLPWKTMLYWIHKNFCGGANQMIFHGYPYAETKTSRWPGYSPFGFGLGGYWGSRNPDWQHISDFTAYLTRIQDVLNLGRPQMDFAILSHKYGTFAPVLQDQTLARLGYCYDVITPNLLELETAEIADYAVCPKGPGYRAIVIDGEISLPTVTLEKLIDCCVHGIPVIFCGTLPQGPSYYGEKPELWEKNMQLLLTKAVCVPSELQLATTMEQLKILPRFVHQVPVSVIHRKAGDQDYYCFWNYSKEKASVAVQLGTDDMARIDPWSGRSYFTDTMELELPPGDFQIYVVGAAADKKFPAQGKQVCTLGPFHLKIDRYESAGDPKHPSRTKYTEVDAGMVSGGYWDDMEILPPEICGMGTYEAEFSWQGGDAAVLRLNRAYYGGIRVLLNGRPMAWDCYTDMAVLDGLQPGKNRIVIELSSTLGNQLIHDGTISAPTWCPEMKPQPESFGFETAVIYQPQ